MLKLIDCWRKIVIKTITLQIVITMKSSIQVKSFETKAYKSNI